MKAWTWSGQNQRASWEINSWGHPRHRKHYLMSAAVTQNRRQQGWVAGGGGWAFEASGPILSASSNLRHKFPGTWGSFLKQPSTAVDALWRGWLLPELQSRTTRNEGNLKLDKSTKWQAHLPRQCQMVGGLVKRRGRMNRERERERESFCFPLAVVSFAHNNIYLIVYPCKPACTSLLFFSKISLFFNPLSPSSLLSFFFYCIVCVIYVAIWDLCSKLQSLTV